MTTTSLSAGGGPTLPAALTTALGHMQRTVACPEEVRARILGLRVVSEDGGHGPRGFVTNWRTAGGGDSRHRGGGGAGAGAGSGFGGGGGHRRDGGGFHGGGGRRDHGGPPRDFRPRGPPPSFRGGGTGRTGAPRFGNRARADVTVEARMMDRIRDKMNKFCESTYDSTKGWLSELLDSGETAFLTDFITLVFDKAAEEPHICCLYARLITELRTGFPQLDTELRRIFSAFLTVFEDAAVEPDAGSADYDAYVALRKRRQLRTGYASFVGEIARLGVLTAADVFTTCHHLLAGIETAKRDAEKQGLVEEYANCLKCLVVGCKELLVPDRGEMYRLTARVGEAKVGLPSRARFALMDVEDVGAAATT